VDALERLTDGGFIVAKTTAQVLDLLEAMVRATVGGTTGEEPVGAGRSPR
jgi:hypothetical protein